jgi:hypothetical protein
MPLMSPASAALRAFGRMADIFRRVDGFAPSSFMVSTGPTSGEEAIGNNRLQRSLHYYPHGSFVDVQVHSPPRRSWARHLAECLARAGYERTWKLDDEIGFRRWLRGPRGLAAELEFLRELGENGESIAWPRRAPNPRPIRPPRRTMAEWDKAVEQAISAGISWIVCMVSYSWRTVLSGAGLAGLTLDVSALGISRSDCRWSVGVDVRLVDGAGGLRKVSPAVVRSLKRDLGLETYQHGANNNELWATKHIRGDSSAARECERIVAQVARLNPVPEPAGRRNPMPRRRR